MHCGMHRDWLLRGLRYDTAHVPCMTPNDRSYKEFPSCNTLDSLSLQLALKMALL